ncbi:MAG: hypothetical protein JSV37_10915 [Anaerolineaceae bacterium]|nr:MAG: hypothetical protein JSV37_10915 [Anaerolineaceae bacterium]
MKSKLFLCLTLLTSLTLAACTRPAKEPPLDRTATMEAATLAAETALPASRTPPPSASPIITPSAISSETPPPSEGPSPTAPELEPDDPRYGLNLASPDYHDNFSSQTTWSGPNFAGAVNMWDDGRHSATDNFADQYIWWSTTKDELDTDNLYAEITVEMGDCSGKDGYGFAVRVSGEMRNSGYTLEFACDGSYRLRKLIAGSVATLIDWTPSEIIQRGPDSVNRMGFLADGNQLNIFANGEVLDQVEDSDLISGNFGLYANAANTPGLTVYFDNFSLWYLES